MLREDAVLLIYAAYQIGMAYIATDDHRNALLWLYKVLDLQEKRLGSEDNETLMALLPIAKEHAALGEVQKAQDICKRILTVRKNIFDPETMSADQYHYDTAQLCEEAGLLDNALDYFLTALDARRASHREEDLWLADIYSRIAYVHYQKERRADAMSWWQTALKVYVELLGVNSPKVRTIQRIMRDCKHELGRGQN